MALENGKNDEVSQLFCYNLNGVKHACDSSQVTQIVYLCMSQPIRVCILKYICDPACQSIDNSFSTQYIVQNS